MVKDEVGLVWLFQNQEILDKFLSHHPPFCDAPLNFYFRRGRQLKPLFPCCPVVFLVGVSRASKVISVIARIAGEPPFKMLATFGTSYQGINLPREVTGFGGRKFSFPDGIWLCDVQYQNMPKSWPGILPIPTGSRLLKPTAWSRLVRSAALIFPPCSAKS